MTAASAEMEKYVHSLAVGLVDFARLNGLVLTIERRPLVPLAMGHAETVVDVRPARVLAAKAEAHE